MKRKIAVITAVLAGIVVIAGCDSDKGGFTNPVQQTTTSQAPKKVTLPAVAGRNAAIVQDDLRKLGLKNVRLASVDPKATVVLVVQNWTAVSIEPAAGSVIDADSVVVVKVTKHS